MRTCHICGLSRPESEYYSNGRGGLRIECKACHGAVKRASLYGVTRDEIWEMEQAQEGRCGICGCTGPLVVDHCHDTEQVRGLLCHHCNTGIGLLKDSYTLLRAAQDWVDPFVTNHAEEALQRTRNGEA